MTYICFDVGGTYVKHGIFNECGELLHKGSLPTSLTSKEDFYQQLIALIHDYEEAHIIKGIGISMPGFIDSTEGVAIMAGALSTLHGEAIVKQLQYQLKADYRILMENDANCAALAELSSGNAVGLSDIVLITVGTGIGGAIVMNKQLYRGHGYRAGEFGQMAIDVSRSRFQTAHELASTTALIQAYRDYKQVDAGVLIDARQIIEEANHDVGVKEVLDQWTSYLSTVIFNVASFFNPEKILIGGGISENTYLLPALLAMLAENPNWKDIQCEIDSCRYFNEAGLRGALGLLKQ